MSENELQSLIKKYSTILNLTESTTLTALRLAKEVKENFIASGKKTKGIAAAVIYIAGILEDERNTQSTIAKVAEVPESTIRNRYVEIVKKLEITRN